MRLGTPVGFAFGDIVTDVFVQFCERLIESSALAKNMVEHETKVSIVAQEAYSIDNQCVRCP